MTQRDRTARARRRTSRGSSRRPRRRSQERGGFAASEGPVRRPGGPRAPGRRAPEAASAPHDPVYPGGGPHRGRPVPPEPAAPGLAPRRPRRGRDRLQAAATPWTGRRRRRRGGGGPSRGAAGSGSTTVSRRRRPRAGPVLTESAGLVTDDTHTTLDRLLTQATTTLDAGPGGAGPRPWRCATRCLAATEACWSDRLALQLARRHDPARATGVDCAVERCVALTFDDGRRAAPAGARGEARLGHVLPRREQRGEAARRRARHGGRPSRTTPRSRPQLTTLDDDAVRDELARARRRSRRRGGHPDAPAAPVRGVDDRVRSVALRSGSRWCCGTSTRSTGSARRRGDATPRGARPGSVVLMHDVGHPSTPWMVDDLRAQGYRLVTVDLLAWTGARGALGTAVRWVGVGGVRQAGPVTASLPLPDDGPRPGAAPAGPAARGPLPPARALKTSAEHPWPVRLLSRKIEPYVERMAPVWVEGQVVQLDPALGHVDGVPHAARHGPRHALPVSAASPRAPGHAGGGGRAHWCAREAGVLDAARHAPAPGARDPSRRRGRLSHRIEHLERVLAAEGLFDADRKRPLPPGRRRAGPRSGSRSARWPSRAPTRCSR